MENKKVISFSAATKEQPFENLNDEDFVKIEDILGKEIIISSVKSFENDSGPGTFFRFDIEIDGKFVEKFTCTHSKPLVAGAAKINDIISSGDHIGVSTKIVKRASKTDKSKQVYSFA